MEVIYSIASKLAGGGIGNTAYYGVKGINKHKALKKVLCSDYKKTEIPENKIKKISTFFDYSPTYFIKNDLFDYMASFHVDKCDVFYGWNGMQLRQMKKAKKLGAKLVCNASSSHVSTHNRLNREEFRKYGLKEKGINSRIMKKVLKEYEEADIIVPASNFVYQSMIEEGIDENKLRLLPFGIDMKKFKAKKKKNEKFIVMYAGFVSILKGTQYLLEAWEKLNLKDAELRIYGKVKNDFKNIIKKYRNNDSIRFMGHVNNLPNEYKKADIFVFPSIQEGSALVTYEAMASGIPMITTFNSGSLARDGKDGFVIPIRNSKIISEKIRYLYDNPKEIERMGKNARKRIEKYTWEKYGDNLVKIMEKTLK